ncbi:helix-turn-helix domain-containing protein [Rothia sp. LK2588]|uniref:helix-turn-helix domain-containing protein n=1 Tax=Rothia sp. LK2588 TaxID=3114369 RepID=UPI0034CDCF6B
MEIPFNSTSLDRLKSIKGFRWDYELAQYLEVDQGTISDWRAGRVKPKYSTVIRLMRGGLTLAEIAGEPEIPAQNAA